MLEFTKEIKIAIEMVNWLDDKPMSIYNMHRNAGYAESTLVSVAKALQAMDIVKSVRGKDGGFILIKKDLKLLDIFQCFYELSPPDKAYEDNISFKVNNLYNSVLASVPVIVKEYDKLMAKPEPLKPSPLSEEEKLPVDMPYTKEQEQEILYDQLESEQAEYDKENFEW